MHRCHSWTTHVSFEVRADYLRVKISGDFPSELEIFETILNEARRTERSRIVIDLFEITPPVSDLARFWAGKTLAEVFGHCYKIVALIQQALINKVGENAAVNRTARLLVTSDEEEGLRWVSG